jgi:molybdopterin-guanine dinucleotide biosynthesis protein
VLERVRRPFRELAGEILRQVTMLPPPPLKAPPERRLDPRRIAPHLRGTIAVAGATSNAGKTRTSELLLAALRRAGVPACALKTTRTHLVTCPRGNDACGTCDSLQGEFELVTDPRRIAEPGKDTARFLAAGAAQVLWLLAKPSAMEEGIRAALAAAAPGTVLVAEGNSFLDWTLVDVALMAVWDREAPKPSAEHVLERIDAFVLRPGRGGAPPPPPRDDLPVLDDAALWPFVASRLGAGVAPR